MNPDCYQNDRFIISLEKVLNLYVAEGTIMIKGKEYAYQADGVLETFLLESGEEGLIGILLGNVQINNKNVHINIAMHSIPTQNELFAFLTIGMLSEEKDLISLIYGKEFNDMTELVNLYSKQSNNEEEVPFKSTENRSAENRNNHFRDISVGYKQLRNGQNLALGTICLYAPYEIISNSTYKPGIKVNGNNENAQIWFQDYYGDRYDRFGVAYTERAELELSSNHSDIEFSLMNPEDSSFNVSIPVPMYIGGVFSFLPWNINIGIFTIRTSQKSSGFKMVTAHWKHNHEQDVSWGSAYSNPRNALNSTKAYAGHASMVNYHNQSNPYNIDLYGSGNITYRCQVSLSMSSQTFVASATVDCGIAKASIEVK